uniref:Prostaglandin D2 receptor 2 n=1 Tax=Echeneis naucrates TaxID=173247 RepID=A0A665VHV6_ECHNA
DHTSLKLYKVSLKIFIISLHGVVSTIGIIENLLILAVVGFHVRRSVISMWILNLAASDLLATLSLPFFTLYMARGDTWTLGPTFCRIHSSIFFLNMFFSAFLLAAISMDRCLVVLRPVWAQNHRNVKAVGKICGAIWALAILCTIPFYIYRDTTTLPSGFLPSEPYDLKALCKYRKEALAFMKLFLAFLIPLLVIILSYSAVSATLAHRGCRRPSVCSARRGSGGDFHTLLDSDHLFIILEVMAANGSALQTQASKALPVSATIGFLNSVLNPILYVFSCPDLCSKIRHSLGAVMESVLAEDLAELARRRSSGRSSISISRSLNRLQNSTGNVNLKSEELALEQTTITAI